MFYVLWVYFSLEWNLIIIAFFHFSISINCLSFFSKNIVGLKESGESSLNFLLNWFLVREFFQNSNFANPGPRRAGSLSELNGWSFGAFSSPDTSIKVIKFCFTRSKWQESVDKIIWNYIFCFAFSNIVWKYLLKCMEWSRQSNFSTAWDKKHVALLFSMSNTFPSIFFSFQLIYILFSFWSVSWMNQLTRAVKSTW